MSTSFRITDSMHWEGPGIYGLFREVTAWHWRKVMPVQPPGTENVLTFERFDKNPLPVTKKATLHNDGQDSEFSDPSYSDPEKE